MKVKVNAAKEPIYQILKHDKDKHRKDYLRFEFRELGSFLEDNLSVPHFTHTSHPNIIRHHGFFTAVRNLGTDGSDGDVRSQQGLLVPQTQVRTHRPSGGVNKERVMAVVSLPQRIESKEIGVLRIIVINLRIWRIMFFLES